MHTEVEAKFLDINPDKLRQVLRAAGAQQVHPERLMRRKNYDFANMTLSAKNGWVRVRHEGNKTTMSYKQLDDRSLHGTKEVNLTIDDFGQADAFLQAIGLKAVSYQETKRESWRLGEVEIELDHWPWTKPYVEIEGPDEASIRAVAGKLKLDWKKAVHGSVEVVYQAEYDATEQEIDNIPVITFEEPIPEWLLKRRKEQT